MRNCNSGFSVNPALSKFIQRTQFGATLSLHNPIWSGIGGVQPTGCQSPQEFPPSRLLITQGPSQTFPSSPQHKAIWNPGSRTLLTPLFAPWRGRGRLSAGCSSKDQKEPSRCRQNISSNWCHTPDIHEHPAARQVGFLSAQDEALRVVYGQLRSAAELSCSI